MPKRKDKQPPIDLLQGTLDLLILQTLLFVPRHGHAVAKFIERLRRMCCGRTTARSTRHCNGWITAAWGTSENNRRARFYRLTLAGRKQLTVEANKWEWLTKAIAHILQPKREEG